MKSPFIHSFWPFLQHPFRSSTTQRRSRLQHRYCVGVSRRSAQATAGKGLAQDPYVAAGAEVEPTTLRLNVIISTKAPPCPTSGTSGGLNPHASFVILMFPHKTRIVLKTLTIILQPLILNRYLPKTFRSDHLIKRVDSLHILHRGLFGALSPKTSLFILMLSPLDSNFAVERYLQNGPAV